ncbi:MAG: Do family serine endopeptidase [Nitrospirae bacterium]|nr:Do family serine endopeptidase [Nitrospirota bacterium]
MRRALIPVTMLAMVLIALPAFAKSKVAIPQSLLQLQDALIALADDVKPAVVNISPLSQTQAEPKPRGSRPDHPGPGTPPGTGSGFIFNDSGYIMTNNHVVGDADEVEVRLSDKRVFTGKVIGRDGDTDVAVVKIDAKNKETFPAVAIGDSSKLKVGQWVIAVGNPFGLDRTVTVGVVSGLGRENVNLSRYEDYIQTDASINPGNSGGPLFNLNGEVVGINTAILNFAQGIGFAIPSNMAKEVADQLVAHGNVVRGWLGIGIQQLTPELSDEFGVKETDGVLVNEVFSGDPADKAGLQPGDIITKVNGRDVATPATLAKLIAQNPPGGNVKIDVLRGGKPMHYTIQLSERPQKPTTVKATPPEEPQAKPEPVLGILIDELTPELADQYKLKATAGIVVSKVIKGSAADAAGLREGDMILEVERTKVKTAKEFFESVNHRPEENKLLLRISREERAFFIVLKPGEVQPSDSN